MTTEIDAGLPTKSRSMKSRRREVLVGVRQPDVLMSEMEGRRPNFSLSTSKSLGADHVDQRELRLSTSGIKDYTLISSRTGGFVGEPPLQDGVGYDDETVHADNTVHSSPAELNNRVGVWGRKHKMTKNLFEPRRRSDRKNPSKRGGFFKRWTSGVIRPTVTSASSTVSPIGVPVRVERPQSFSNKTAASAGGYSSDRSTGQRLRGSHSFSTPTRSNNSPRFILPDDTPPGSKSTRLKKPRGSTVDHTSAAVVHLKAVSTSPRFILPDHTPPGSKSVRHEKTRGSTVDHTSAAVVHHSHISSNSSDEQGFEVSIASPLPCSSSSAQQRATTMTLCSAPIDLDAGDEGDYDDSTVGSWISKLKFTDQDLMDDPVASGVLRLTADGLKRHESRTGELKLASPSLQQYRSEVKKPLPNRRSANKIARSIGSLLKKKKGVEADVTDFSVAPLNAMDNLNLETTASALKRSKTESDFDRNCNTVGGMVMKNWGFALRRKEACSATAVALLERERLAVEETQSKKLFSEEQEMLRIDQMRREYLELERARERDQPQNISPEQRESIFISLELVEKDNTAGKGHATRTRSGADYTQSTVSSRSVATPPVCVLCKRRERTHTATPGMHVAYCEDCAKRLSNLDEGCAFCSS